MAIIDVTTLVDIPKLQEDWPDFKAVTDCDREKIRPEMEVRIRSNSEDIRVKVEEVNGDEIVGKVLTEIFYFDQQFEYLDMIRFEKKNVIDIYIINGVYY